MSHFTLIRLAPLTLVLLLPGTFCPTQAETPESRQASPPREKVPAGQSLESGKKTVEEVFGQRIRTLKSVEEAAALATELLSVGVTTENDPGGRYALYDSARQLAEKAGNLQLAFRACDHIANAFEADRLLLQESSFVACAKEARRPAEIAPLIAAGLSLADEAIAADRYAVARKVLSSTSDLARRTRQRELAAKAAAASRRVDELSAAFEAVQPSFQQLQRQPDDAPSHSSVGRFLCFYKGDWERGLAHLAQGSDAALRELAAKEIAAPKTPELQLALGDAWLDRATAAAASDRLQIEGRAAFWYQLARPALSGFELARVEKALAAIPAASQAAAAEMFAKRWKPLVGTWNVRYDSGALRTYRIDDKGKVQFVDESRPGTLTPEGEFFKLDFADGKLERLRLENDELAVEHFDPASNYPNGPALRGRAVRAER